jgi:hypothetical protein
MPKPTPGKRRDAEVTPTHTGSDTGGFPLYSAYFSTNTLLPEPSGRLSLRSNSESVSFSFLIPYVPEDLAVFSSLQFFTGLPTVDLVSGLEAQRILTPEFDPCPKSATPLGYTILLGTIASILGRPIILIICSASVSFQTYGSQWETEPIFLL